MSDFSSFQFLIKTARAQILSAKEHASEGKKKGDLRNALALFIKAATLAKMAIDSNEFAEETRTKNGFLRNELTEFVEVSPSIIQPDVLNLIKFFSVSMTDVISMRVFKLLRWKVN